MLGAILKILTILWNLVGPIMSVLSYFKKKTPEEAKAAAEAKVIEAKADAEARRVKALERVRRHQEKREARKAEIMRRLEERRRKREERAEIRNKD